MNDSLKKTKALEKFNKLAGGISKTDLEDAANKNRLKYLVKSKWYDVMGKADENFIVDVTDEIWKLLEREKEESGLRSDFVKK